MPRSSNGIDEGHTTGLLFVLPVLSRITRLEFLEGKVEAEVTFAPDLGSLFLYLHHFRPGQLNTPLSLAGPIHVEASARQGGAAIKWSHNITPGELAEGDEIRATLVDGDIGTELDMKGDSLCGVSLGEPTGSVT